MRTWIQLGGGLVVMLFLVFIAVMFWPTVPPSPEVIAKRGLEAPEKRSTAWNGSFGAVRDLLDQGWDALARWDESPFGIQKDHFGQHLSRLNRSKVPKDQEEYRRLLGLAKRWHANLLSRYPELRVAYRNVPDDRNALKRLYDLQKRFQNDDGSTRFDVPSGLRDSLNKKAPWDPKAAQAWLDANRAVVDELRTICLMPDSSGKDIEFSAFWSGIVSDGHHALLLEARLAAERGEIAAAMESVQAAVSMANLLRDMEAPTLLQSLIGSKILRDSRDTVIHSILPELPAESLDLVAWENLMDSTVQTPADFARTYKGEWNAMMTCLILPALADPAESETPTDAEVMIEAYTSYVSRVVQYNTPLALTDLPTHPNPDFDPSGLSWRSQQFTSGLVANPYRNLWERQQIQIGLTQAAFAILKGQPVPNDPIHGQPYQWNPETRELSPPKGPQFSIYGKYRIKLPKL